MVGGFALNTLNTGFDGASTSLLGFVIGFLAFLPFYLKKGMGAGDVKLMAAIGAVLGPWPTVTAVASTLVFGMIYALVLIAVNGELLQCFVRWYLSLKHFIYSRSKIYMPPPKDSIANTKFPYALAIVSGYCVAMYYSTPSALIRSSIL